MKKFLFPLLLLASSLSTLAVYAKDVIGGMTLDENFAMAKKFPMPSAWLLSAQCSACHGTFGAEFDDIIPPLAGIDKQEFVDKMQRYKTHDANNFIVMGIVAQTFTDEEIIAMANFFSKQSSTPRSEVKGHKDVIVPDWAQMKRTH